MKRRTKIIVTIIIIVISIVTVSSPLVILAHGKRIGLLANYYGELPIELDKGSFDSLLIIDDNEAMNIIKPTPIIYSNPNGFDKQVNLIMTINKNSSINYNNVVISVNDNILSLSDLIIDYDEYNYYFNIGSKTIPAYSNNQDMFRIWLRKETSGLTEESEITFNFIIKD